MTNEQIWDRIDLVLNSLAGDAIDLGLSGIERKWPIPGNRKA